MSVVLISAFLLLIRSSRYGKSISVWFCSFTFTKYSMSLKFAFSRCRDMPALFLTRDASRLSWPFAVCVSLILSRAPLNRLVSCYENHAELELFNFEHDPINYQLLDSTIFVILYPTIDSFPSQIGASSNLSQWRTLDITRTNNCFIFIRTGALCRRVTFD